MAKEKLSAFTLIGSDMLPNTIYYTNVSFVQHPTSPEAEVEQAAFNPVWDLDVPGKACICMNVTKHKDIVPTELSPKMRQHLIAKKQANKVIVNPYWFMNSI